MHAISNCWWAHSRAAGCRHRSRRGLRSGSAASGHLRAQQSARQVRSVRYPRPLPRGHGSASACGASRRVPAGSVRSVRDRRCQRLPAPLPAPAGAAREIRAPGACLLDSAMRRARAWTGYRLGGSRGHRLRMSVQGSDSPAGLSRRRSPWTRRGRSTRIGSMTAMLASSTVLRQTGW